MKTFLLSLILILSLLKINAQSCQDMIDFVKKDNYGTTYTSYNSEAISKVTFYNKTLNYNTYYFAIVCFKTKYSYSCSEYIYQVASNTKYNYSQNYLNSAGKAFWKYIKPYNEILECAPE
ncbi:hypothetical protein [Lacinutrix venerupis]|uniref:KTSC domain-containing protein n=1 Tax=Lacinutrix venerupis TaxID=1486034 RepID=A0AAC9LLA4_9FLAO|nr:hypothetical protein [Lacinutrix venerupis]APY00544.1 hypothetical protein BWR22_09505 [Lacinutrix venerupis]